MGPIVAVEFPEVRKLLEDKKEEVRKAEIRDELKGMDIKKIVAIQNLPTPLERWKESKILLPTRYLAAATHFFVYSQAMQEAPMTNKFVAKKFNVSLSTLTSNYKWQVLCRRTRKHEGTDRRTRRSHGEGGQEERKRQSCGDQITNSGAGRN